MGNFKSKAISATTVSKIMEGKTKISTDELITKYPEGVTITGFDWMNGDNGKYPVCVFSENANECFFGGTALTEICESWMDGYTDCESCSADLQKEGGVKIKFSKGKTKNNRSFTRCDVVE